LHPLALTIRQLLRRSEKKDLGRILIDDEENILQALDARVSVHSVFHAGEEVISERLRQKLSPSVTIYEVAKRTCKKLFENEKVSRVFAIAETPALLGLESLAAIPRDIVVLEDVSISGNIGAIIRTSLALGIGGIVLLNKDPVDIYDRRLIRASRGYVFSLPVVTATTEELLRFCKQRNLHVLVTTTHADTLVHEISSLSERLAIIFGSEKEGCSQSLLDAATLRVKIPTNPQVESLNVSAAAGITLFCRLRFNHIAFEVG
jgi:tRNA G18 (ribose-2'-O)-methylase SpoU